jgi:hypothetical protein
VLSSSSLSSSQASALSCLTSSDTTKWPVEGGQPGGHALGIYTLGIYLGIAAKIYANAA